MNPAGNGGYTQFSDLNIIVENNSPDMRYIITSNVNGKKKNLKLVFNDKRAELSKHFSR